MSNLFLDSKFNGDISQWNVANVSDMECMFEDCESSQIPYWAKIENTTKRQKAILEYQDILNNKRFLEQKINNELNIGNLHKI